MKAFYSDSIYYYQREIARHDQSQDIKNLIAAHERQMQARRHQEERLAWLFAFLGIMALAIILWMLKSNRTLAKWLHLYSRLDAVKVEIIEQSDPSEQPGTTAWDDHTARLEQLRIDQLALCREQFLKTEGGDRLHALLMLKKGFSPETSSPSGQDKDQKSMITKCLDSSFSDVYIYLLSKYEGKLTKADCQLCVLSYLGATTELCGYLLDSTAPTTRRRRSRIYQDIGESDGQLFFPNRRKPPVKSET